jgi:N-acetylglutamate synthase-like GNAT family acetyltransferase
MTATFAQGEQCIVRQRVLGSEALYRLISEEGATVTAEVVAAPGLQRGMRLRLMATAVRAMERLDLAETFAVSRRFDPSAPAFGPTVGAAR